VGQAPFPTTRPGLYFHAPYRTTEQQGRTRGDLNVDVSGRANIAAAYHNGRPAYDGKQRTDRRLLIRSTENLRETVRVLFSRSNLSLAQLAAVAFVVGVLFHVCVAYAVLDDGSGSQEAAGAREPAIISTAVATQRPPTPTPNPSGDRTSCAEIRATDYRSPTERDWFLRNCS
jgi:hypothetical protein